MDTLIQVADAAKFLAVGLAGLGLAGVGIVLDVIRHRCR